MQRYFPEKKEHDNFILYPKDIHHIKNVMRNKIGDKIEVIYDSIVYLCEISSLEPFTINIIHSKNEDRDLPIELTIAISLVNEQKFDLILQKLTELGVSKIIPLKTERSIVKLDETKALKKYSRWQTICKEASEQSHRTTIPKIEKIMTVKELANYPSDLKLLCSLSQDTKELSNHLDNNIKSILFAIGPEGGFTNQEETILINGSFRSTTLGKRVLRVETAAIYVSSIINYVYKG